jgi:hypothetical protein
MSPTGTAKKTSRRNGRFSKRLLVQNVSGKHLHTGQFSTFVYAITDNRIYPCRYMIERPGKWRSFAGQNRPVIAYSLKSTLEASLTLAFVCRGDLHVEGNLFEKYDYGAQNASSLWLIWNWVIGHPIVSTTRRSKSAKLHVYTTAQHGDTLESKDGAGLATHRVDDVEDAQHLSVPFMRSLIDDVQVNIDDSVVFEATNHESFIRHLMCLFRPDRIEQVDLDETIMYPILPTLRIHNIGPQALRAFITIVSMFLYIPS